MATIKAIEASSVHQIQSGQVIVDLCSVAKELVENGLDAGATSIDVRFKNQGLDSIEVQDNGAGISPANYESVALKHYTSKLSSYSDLTTLETFGFRGEALSSLCALSRFTVTTCLQADVPKGTKLEFETSGKLKGTTVVAAQKGTTVAVENLFQNLPVRRRELERNIKREWGKVISLLNQYACIQTGVKFTVSQTPLKGKRIVLFSTRGNKATRENIINVFGAKTMGALVALDLKLELEPTMGSSQRWSHQDQNDITREVLIKGYVSRPLHGEGRQTPDRQMFYVNSRPCGLPQVAKVFNEVYRSFNSSQSPFIFADIQLDTSLYDVNVSPDKRTILLHDQSRMLDGLRDSLTALFESQDYTMPMSQITPFKQPTLKKLGSASKETLETGLDQDQDAGFEGSTPDAEISSIDRMRNLAAAKALAKDAISSTTSHAKNGQRRQGSIDSTAAHTPVTEKAKLRHADLDEANSLPDVADQEAEIAAQESLGQDTEDNDILSRVSNFKRSFLPHSLQDDTVDAETPGETPIPSIPKLAKPTDNAPLSSTPTNRPAKRPLQEVATITIGDHTVTSIIGTPSKKQKGAESPARAHNRSQPSSKALGSAAPLPSFGGRLTQMFAAASARRQAAVDSSVLRTQTEGSSDDEDDGHSSANVGSEKSFASTHDENMEDDARALREHSESMFVEQEDDELLLASTDDDAHNNSDADQALASPHNEDHEMEEADDGDYVDDNDDGDVTMKDVDADKIEASDGEAAASAKAQSEAIEENVKRTAAFLKGAGGAKGKYSTHSLVQRLKIDEHYLRNRIETWDAQISQPCSTEEALSQGSEIPDDDLAEGLDAANAEEKLSLRIHKDDFGKMKIIGQFNLGFILAVRPRTNKSTNANNNDINNVNTTNTTNKNNDDELFIIDQHASDEKFNFERLQATTTVQSQRLVRPKPLELTAVEEEIVIENQAALEKNGFIVSVDESGDEPVGSRCELLSLPLSRETAFSIADLEELISLLGDHPTSLAFAPPRLSSPLPTLASLGPNNQGGNDDEDDGEDCGVAAQTRQQEEQQEEQRARAILDKYIPRPSKVRKMFAMRACRSSIMIGKALSHRQMEQVVRHMGEMEKPWNCPHGRPTMRHLCGLGSAWDGRVWQEGEYGDVDDIHKSHFRGTTDWAKYVQER